MAKNRFHTGSGPSQRQLRVGEILRRELSQVLLRGEVHDPELSAMSITVSEVRMSPDLKVATVFVCPLGGDVDQKARLIPLLSDNAPALRRAVASEVQLKFAPQLRFRLDESFDRMEETRQLLQKEDVKRDLG